ncbi:DUF6264 family protein [Naasia sp. SYSU D00057]|uniref:DUF6264 family protein n=1 Tax=Naasia sp. SYSU D00057 TaxID=2817380 RepID=UPI001B305AA1|nr:DUF6264 family protein [Naasia sp. SYSU D00057]
MTDRPTSGPAPRYGEYAPVPPELPEVPAAAEPQPEPVADTAPAAAGRRGPTWDRVLTIGLLVLGVLNVLSSIPQFLRLPETLDEAYALQGFGDFTADSLASAVGVGINVVNVLLLLGAVALSVARLRAGRIAFWVPVVAGVLAVIATIVLLAVAMLSDPTLAAYLEQGGTAP